MAGKKFSRLSVLLEARDRMSGPFRDAARNAERVNRRLGELADRTRQGNNRINIFSRTLRVLSQPIKAVTGNLAQMARKMTEAVGNSKVGQLARQTKTWKLMSQAVDKTKGKLQAAALAAGLFLQNNERIDRVVNSYGRFTAKINQAKAAFQRMREEARRGRTETENLGDRGRSTFNQLVLANQRLNAQLERMNRSINRGNRGLSTMKGNIRGINALSATFTALYTAQTLGHGASNLTGATVGKAMEQQYSQVSVGLIAGDQKKGAAYWKQIQEYASQTTYSAEDWARSMRGAISKSDTVKDLEKYQIVLEQLATLDPIQGLDGAALAVRELNSGDIVSLVERFELPRSALKKIKAIKDPIEQIEALSKMIGEETGYTVKAISSMKELPLMQWEKFKNTIKTVGGYIGSGALSIISPFIEQVNQMYTDGKFDGFIKRATEGFKNLVQGIIDFATGVYNAFASGEIQKQMEPFTNLFSLVMDTWSEAWPGIQVILENAKTILGEVANAISVAWPFVNEVLQIAVDLVKDFSTWVVDNWGTLAPIIGGVVGAMAGLAIAGSVATGIAILKGVIQAIRTPTLLWAAAMALVNLVMAANPITLVVTVIGFLVGALVTAYLTSDTFREKVQAAWSWLKDKGAAAIDFGKAAIDRLSDALSSAMGWVEGLYGKMSDFVGWIGRTKINWKAFMPGGDKFIETAPKSGGGGNKKHGGLSNVPTNGYGATLHKGERVLTAMENKAYTKSLYGGSGGGSGVTVTGNTFIVRSDTDIDAIANVLYNKLSEAMG